MSYFDGEEGQIQAETMEITVSLVCQLSSSGENYLRMKKQVDRLIHRHELLFTGMLRKLDSLSLSIRNNEQNRQDIVDDHLCADLTRIFNVLIQVDQITWGKIITILAFSTFAARKHAEIADRIAHVTGQYLVKKLSGWIKEHGGWVRLRVRFWKGTIRSCLLEQYGSEGLRTRPRSFESILSFLIILHWLKFTRSILGLALVICFSRDLMLFRFPSGCCQMIIRIML